MKKIQNIVGQKQKDMSSNQSDFKISCNSVLEYGDNKFDTHRVNFKQIFKNDEYSKDENQEKSVIPVLQDFENSIIKVQIGESPLLKSVRASKPAQKIPNLNLQKNLSEKSMGLEMAKKPIFKIYPMPGLMGCQANTYFGGLKK